MVEAHPPYLPSERKTASYSIDAFVRIVSSKKTFAAFAIEQFAKKVVDLLVIFSGFISRVGAGAKLGLGAPKG